MAFPVAPANDAELFLVGDRYQCRPGWATVAEEHFLFVSLGTSPEAGFDCRTTVVAVGEFTEGEGDSFHWLSLMLVQVNMTRAD